MKILRITKINKCRTFHDFSWPSTLPEFQDFNLIYGWNGTGKTTIADIFRAIERKQTAFDGEFTVVTDKATIKSSDLESGWANQIPPIRVFNRTYVEENIFATSNGAITPIFFLGEESVEKQKLVEAKTAKCQEETDKRLLKSKEKEGKERELDALCVKGAKAVKDALLSSGSNPYNTYDKRGFKATIERIARTGADASTYAQTDDQKAQLKAQFSGAHKESLVLPTFSLPDIAGLHAAAVSLLEKSVVSEAISTLQHDEKLSTWVKQGLDIHHDGGHGDCQFCLQPLPPQRVKALEGHFNDEYTRMMEDISDIILRIDATTKNLDTFSPVDKAAICEHLVTPYANAISALHAVIESYKSFLNTLKGKLEEKRAKPFDRVSYNDSLPDAGKEALEAYIAVVKQHNTDSENHASAVSNARKKYEEAIVAEYLDEYKTLKKAVEDAESLVVELQGTIATLSADIKALEIAIKEHRKPAEEINKDLQSYLGHEELKFETQENGYVIYRFGQAAKDLSEGEKTAIALLYFLKTLEDKNFKPKGIVVIDDPVCSMDDGALFHAFGYIKAKTKDAKQLFILTHNFVFFRQVKNWFKYAHHSKKAPQKAQFYQTHCSLQSGVRHSNLDIVDPLLLDYESEYHFLFQQVCDASRASGSGDLGKFYSMPNVARRVLESFLAFRKPSVQGKDRLYSMLEATNFDSVKKTKILRFMHVHSHEDLGTQEHDPSVLTETPQIMTALLELIESEDQGHYEEMMKVVNPAGSATVLQKATA